MVCLNFISVGFLAFIVKRFVTSAPQRHYINKLHLLTAYIVWTKWFTFTRSSSSCNVIYMLRGPLSDYLLFYVEREWLRCLRYEGPICWKDPLPLSLACPALPFPCRWFMGLSVARTRTRTAVLHHSEWTRCTARSWPRTRSQALMWAQNGLQWP